MSIITGEVRIEEVRAAESGIHPTARCLEAGEDLRAALLQLCNDDDAPTARVWSLVPVARTPREET